jgi:hypothetical protein
MTKHHRQEKQFGLVLAVILTITALWPLSNGNTPLWGILLIAAISVLISLLVPPLLSPILKVWLPLGHQLGRINTFILLALVYLLLITPVALLFRLLHRDLLKRRRTAAQSDWVIRDEPLTPQSFKKQY